MFSRTASVFLAAIGCARILYAGQEIGNGGDPMRLNVEEGRQRAIEMLEDAGNKDFPDTAEGQWLRIYNKQLAEDLRETKISWVDDLGEACPKSSCACTVKQRKAEIFLSKVHCAGKITDADTASKLLVHEASHHFEIDDETLADRIAILAMRDEQYFQPTSLFRTFRSRNVEINIATRFTGSTFSRGGRYQGYGLGLRGEGGSDYRLGYFYNSYEDDLGDGYLISTKWILNYRKRLVGADKFSSAIRNVLHGSMTPFFGISLGYAKVSALGPFNVDLPEDQLESRSRYISLEPETGIDIRVVANFSMYVIIGCAVKVFDIEGGGFDDQLGLFSGLGFNYFF